MVYVMYFVVISLFALMGNVLRKRDCDVAAMVVTVIPPIFFAGAVLKRDEVWGAIEWLLIAIPVVVLIIMDGIHQHNKRVAKTISRSSVREEKVSG